MVTTRGTVIVGTGLQTSGVAAGSRHGLTRVDAVDLVLQGGNLVTATTPFAMLGYRAVDQGDDLHRHRPHLGHGEPADNGHRRQYRFRLRPGRPRRRRYRAWNSDVDGNFVGPVAMVAGGNVTFQGGVAERLRPAGQRRDAVQTATTAAAIPSMPAATSSSRAAVGDTAYAQLGNGGHDADGNHSGNHILHATAGNVTFQGGIATPPTPSWATVGTVQSATTAAATASRPQPATSSSGAPSWATAEP